MEHRVNLEADRVTRLAEARAEEEALIAEEEALVEAEE